MFLSHVFNRPFGSQRGDGPHSVRAQLPSQPPILGCSSSLRSSSVVLKITYPWLLVLTPFVLSRPQNHLSLVARPQNHLSLVVRPHSVRPHSVRPQSASQSYIFSCSSSESLTITHPRLLVLTPFVLSRPHNHPSLVARPHNHPSSLCSSSLCSSSLCSSSLCSSSLCSSSLCSSSLCSSSLCSSQPQ